MLAATMFGATSCSDYSDYNTVPVDSNPSANNTLWENIVSDPQLTKFAALAQQCKFSEALNSPRFYTVWAPTNEAISEAEFNRLMASDSATIVKQFIQQHITEYNYPVSSALENKTIISLNLKHHDFTQSSFDGFPYAAINQPATNGVMHKINGYSEFFPNLYENIDNLVGCDSLKKYIQKYDEYYLDVNASVIGPLVNGQQTYLDSVMKKRNNVIRSIMRADLEAEDSTYCMIIANDKAWKDAYDKIYPCYNYIAKMDYMDLSKKEVKASDANATTAKADKAVETTKQVLQDSITCRNIVNNLVYSNFYQKNLPYFGQGTFVEEDTTLSTSGHFLTNAQEVINHTVETAEMSNGMTRTVDSLTTYPWETYNPVISSTRPAQTLKVKKLTTWNILGVTEDSPLLRKVPKMIKKWILPETSRFFTYTAVDSANVEGSGGSPEFDFALRNVRSATYHIYVVVVPPVFDPNPVIKPYYLSFYLSWTDANNKQQYTMLPLGVKKGFEITTDNGTSTSKVTYVGDPELVNVIDLGEFTFPASYYGLDAYPSLMMAHTKTYGTSGNRRKYDQLMRVAGVYLVPKEYNDYWINKE